MVCSKLWFSNWIGASRVYTTHVIVNKRVDDPIWKSGLTAPDKESGCTLFGAAASCRTLRRNFCRALTTERFGERGQFVANQLLRKSLLSIGTSFQWIIVMTKAQTTHKPATTIVLVWSPKTDQFMWGASNQIHMLEKKAQKENTVDTSRNCEISCFISSMVCGSRRLRRLRTSTQAQSNAGIRARPVPRAISIQDI
jgi:hypothetical protein